MTVRELACDAPWPRARELAHAAARPSTPSTESLAEAAGSTLAEELRTRFPLPAFDTAAMDGYAVAGTDLGGWRLLGAVRAGSVWSGGALEPGQAVEISTGAPVPEGAHAILPLELATTDGSFVRGAAREAGRHIRRIGEDAPAGMTMAPAGSRVTPPLLGLAAACGYDTLRVRPRPRVRVVVTGDELTDTGRPGPGTVRDALGPMLPSLIDAFGGRVTEVSRATDRPGGLLAAVHARQGAESGTGTGAGPGTGTGTDPGSEVIVVTGSTSVGATDQLRRLLREAGARWIVDGVACRPGHPQLLAELPAGPWIVGLPGNPYAALVAACTLLGPLLDGLSGRPLPTLPMIPVTGGAAEPGGRTRLLPVVWEGAGARIIGGHRSAFLRGAALADALAAIAPGWTPGDPAALILLPR